MKIGDNVKISKYSPFYEEQGNHGIGKIIRSNITDEKWYRVEFKDRYDNDYTEDDLIVLSWKDRFSN